MIHIAYIYKITNDINNKIYIGKTESKNPEDRWKEHLREYIRKRCEKRPLYSAMNKYGKEHFHFEVIEETDNPEEREQYWIDKLRTYVGFEDCNGYNATLGGDGKSYLNLNEDEVIKYHIEEACYISGRTAKYFNVDPDTIKPILKNKNILYLNTKDSNNLHAYENWGGVLQIDMKSKIILNIFENASKANNYMGKKDNCSTIGVACLGTRGHCAYGYLWYYGKDISKAIENGDVIEPDKLGQEYYKQIEV